MSQLNRASDLSFSSPAPRPSFSQASIPSFSTSLQPILNQKLIPRDYLGKRSKALPDTVSDPLNNSPKPPPAVEKARSDQGLVVRFTKHIHTSISQDKTATWTGETLQETNTRRDNDLNISKPGTLESIESIESPLIVRQRKTSTASTTLSTTSHFPGVIMPRTSSIDSAISNVSSTSLNKATSDVREPSPTTVRNLIATAGSAETLIVHLLKEKNNVASQNAQLWKLVEKQRALLLGLNKDLERLTKERDKYKKRVREIELQSVSETANYLSRTSPLSKGDYQNIQGAGVVHHGLQSSDTKHDDHRAQYSALSYAPTQGLSVRTLQEQEMVGKENMQVVQQASNPTPPEVDHQLPDSSGLSLPESKLLTPDALPNSCIVDEAAQLVEKPNKNVPSGRKAPPKPLNLAQGKDDGFGQPLTTQSDIDEEPERGRRRTRAEDDRDREMSAKKAEEEARSRSKKNKVPKLPTTEINQLAIQTQVPAPLPTPGLPLSPRPQHAQTFVASATHLSPVNTSQPGSLNELLYTSPLKSPGLPLSPRPINRNDGQPLTIALPLSPRANMGAFPLSPRAPKQPLPAPTNPSAPTDAAALQNTQSRSYQPASQLTSPPIVDRLQLHQPVGSEAPPVYRGLAVSAYPNLLLPPNALPSIQVKVHSSRLRPSRHTVLGLKTQEETTVFSLSIISRSSNSELWRIEKIPATLPQLELQLKPRCAELPRIPDRKLFAGQSPASLDDRRVAIDNYFEELLDIHVDEQAAIMICRFLSTDVIDPEQQPKSGSPGAESGPLAPSLPGGPITKTGYLSKKGKNFGGWKSRFFILDGPELRYYESAGGPHLGTIRLQNALIGRQKENDSVEEGDGQFRHAFLVQEPKRKDAGNYVRHILCAESDVERDEWVRQLLYWVDIGNASKPVSRNGSITSTAYDLNDLDYRGQGSRAGPSSKDAMASKRDTHVNTPTPTSGSSIDSSILDHATTKPATISGPLNGAVITDNSTWGNKAQLPAKEAKDKTHKINNIFSFRKPEPPVALQDQKPAKPRILRHNGYVRPVFGLPLAEAVEFCAPFNVDVDLPAVVYRSIEYLRHKNAANEEGLFRLSGSNVVVRNLKERFNNEGDIDLSSEDEYHDVHAVASLFKTYLRELPTTILTRELHLEFIKVLEMDNHADRISAFNSLVHMLPPANFSLLKEMSKYLLEVTRNADKNKMSVRNIGIVFSPTLNIPTPVFTLFLTEYADIFENQPGQSPEIRTTEIKAPQSLSPDDVRSPRHQMFSDLPTPAYHQTTFQGQAAVAPPRGTMTGTGELGFMPISQVYDSANYVSAPRNISPPQLIQPLAQVADVGGFGSLNGLLAPSEAPTDRAKKRESVMLLSS